MRRNASSSFKKLNEKIKKENNLELFHSCLKMVWNEIVSKFFDNFKKMKLSTQSMLIFFPLIIILGLCLAYAHFQEYDKKFILDYRLLYDEQLISRLIDDQIAFQIDLSTNSIRHKINNNFKHLVFYKIYFKELIEKNFLDEKVLTDIQYANDIFSDIFSSDDKLMNNTEYTIDINDMEVKMEKNTQFRNASEYNCRLVDLMKHFYLFSPLFIQNEYFCNNYLLTNFFIAYPVVNNSEVSPLQAADGIDYFQYPVAKNFFKVKKINFEPYDNFLDPYPWYMKNITNYSNNWFTKIDYEFLNQINSINKPYNSKTVLSYTTSYFLNKDIKADKIYFPFLQYYFETKKGLKVVIEIVLKYRLHNNDNKEFQYFSFLNFEKDLNTLLKEDNNSAKFFDDSNVISTSKFQQYSSPAIYENYFRKGIIPKNENLSFKGYNIDIPNFNDFSTMEEEYNINDYFKSDMLIYNIIFLYNSIYLKLRQKIIENDKLNISKNITVDDSYIVELRSVRSKNKNEDFKNLASRDSIVFRVGKKDSNIISDVCNKFNFTNYLEIVKNYSKLNCFNDVELSIFVSFNTPRAPTFPKPDYPNCLCLPFYCLNWKNSEQVRNFENFFSVYHEGNYTQFNDEMFLPSRCEYYLNTYKETDITNQTSIWLSSYKLEFSFDSSGIPFSDNISLLNIFVISGSSGDEILGEFTTNLERIVYLIILIYSLLMTIVVVVISLLSYYKLGYINLYIKKIEEEHKHDFIKGSNKKPIVNPIKHIVLNKATITQGRRANVFHLRENHTSLVKSNSQSSIKSPIKDNKLENSKTFNNSNNKNNNYERDRKLATIKEFNEGVSETENDDSVLIEPSSRLQKKKDNIIYEENNDNENQEDFAKNFNLVDESDESKTSDQKSHKDRKEINETEKMIPLDVKEATDQQIRSKIRLNKTLKRISIAKEIVDTAINSFKAQMYPNELLQILELVKMNSVLFQIDFNFDRNVHDKQIIISKYQFLHENTKKFNQLLETGNESEDKEILLGKELSKTLLYEVISTEFCNFQGMCFNFRFKYVDNATDDTSTIKKILYTTENINRRKSSFVANHISSIQKKLKLIEKETIFDFFNHEIESNMTIEEQKMDILSEVSSLQNFKSIVNYYLQNMHLEWIKKIYEVKIAEECES